MTVQAQTTWYVDAEDGSDTNAGNAASAPFETINKAVNTASGGDVIRIRGDQGYNQTHEGVPKITIDKELDIKAVEDPSSGEQEVLIASNLAFDIDPTGTTPVSLGETGDGFFTFNGSFTITSGALTTTASNVHIGGGVTVSRDGGDPVVGGFTYDGAATLDYSAGGLTTGAELPSSFAAIELTNSGGGTITFGGNANIQQLTHDNAGTFDLDGNTLTLTNNSGGTITHDNENTVSNGSVVFAGSNQHTIDDAAGGGTWPDVTVEGTLEFNDTNAAVTHNFGGFTMDSGSTVNAGTGAGNVVTIDFSGDFTRNGGTFNEDNSLLQASGSGDAVFTPGQNLTISDLTVGKSSSGRLTFSGSPVDLTGDFTVNSTSEVDLGGNDIRLKGTASSADMDGTMISGNGAIQFKNSSGSTGTIAGDGTYTNIEVVLSVAGNNVTVGADEQVDFSGTLLLENGNLQVDGSQGAAGVDDISPTSGAKVVRNPSGGNQNISLVNAGTFNTDGNAYDLTYIRNTSSTQATAGELDQSTIRDLTVNTTGSGVQLPGATFTIDRNLTVSGILVTQGANTYTVSGALTVNSGGEIQDDGANDATFTLDNDGSTHTIAGAVDPDGTTNGNITVDIDNNATLNGSTTAGDAASVTNLDLGDGGTALTIDVNNLQEVFNTVTVTAGGPSVDLGLFDGGNAGEGEIGGQVTVNSGTFTLTSDVTSTVANASAIDVDGSSTFDYGSNNVNLIGDGNSATGLDVNGGATINGTGTVTLGDGSDTPTLTINDNSLTNLTIEDETTLSTNATVTSTLDQNDDITGSGDFFLSGDATINDPSSGDATFDAGTFNVTGSTLTGETDVEFNNLTINTSGTSTFATNDAANPRQFEVTSAFNQTDGNIELGPNDLKITTASFTAGNNAGSWTASGGLLILDDAGNPNTFESFDTNGNKVSIPNVEIQRSGGATADTDDGYRLQSTNDELEITNALNLTGATLDASTNSAQITIGDGVLITRDLGALDQDPVFGNNISVDYDGAVNTDEELPSTVVDFTADAAITLDKDVTVTNLFDNNAASDIDAALTLDTGAELALGNAFAGGSSGSIAYNGDATLRYNGAGSVNGGGVTEWKSAKSNTDVIIESALELNDDGLTARNVDFQTSGDDDFDVANSGDQTLTVLGDVTQAADAGFFTNDDNDNTGTVVLGGSSQQTLTLNGDGQFDVVDSGGDNDEVLELELNNSAGATLSGGNLIMDAQPGSNEGVTRLVLTEGNFATGSNFIRLDHEETSVQGFSRPSGGGTVIGNVQKEVPSTGTNANTLEFPTGKDGSSIHRPISITFNSPNQVSTTGIYLEANHDPTNPQGANGIDEITTTDFENDALDIDRYPDFHWDVEATSTLSPSVEYDLELDAPEAPEFADEDIERVRVLNRADGVNTNRWNLNGSGAGDYNNRQPSSNRAIAVVRNNTGGLVSDPGQIFTFGLENNLEAAQIADKEVDAGASTTGPFLGSSATNTGTFSGGTGEYQYSGTVQDQAGNDVTLGVTSSDDNVATGSVNGSDELVVDGKNAGTATLTITMADQLNIIQSQTVDVQVNGGVAFVSGGELQDQTVFEFGGVNNSPFTFTYDAEDQDPGESLSDATDPYQLVNPPNNVSIDATTGELTFEPSFAQAQSSSPVTVEVQVTDNDGLSATTTADLTVEFDRVLGDVDGSGFANGSRSSDIGSGDALAVLEIAVGRTTFETGGLAGTTVNDRHVRAADCAPLADPNDASQGCGGDTPNQANRGDVNSGDALATLQVGNAASGNTNAVTASETSAKAVADASGALTIEDAQVEGNTATLPVVLSDNASNVRAADLTLDLSDLDAEVQSVTDNLPDGWMTAQNVSDGELKVGMIGQRAPASGTVAEIKLDLSGESLPEIEGQYRLNGGDTQDLDVQVVPSKFELKGNYPNPVSRSTTIEYQVSKKAPVTLEVYNTLGQKVATLVNETKEAGQYEVTLDAGSSGLSSGVYFYRLNAGNFTANKRMTVVR